MISRINERAEVAFGAPFPPDNGKIFFDPPRPGFINYVERIVVQAKAGSSIQTFTAEVYIGNQLIDSGGLAAEYEFEFIPGRPQIGVENIRIELTNVIFVGVSWGIEASLMGRRESR